MIAVAKDVIPIKRNTQGGNTDFLLFDIAVKKKKCGEKRIFTCVSII
jgi:hypothetical protein